MMGCHYDLTSGSSGGRLSRRVAVGGFAGAAVALAAGSRSGPSVSAAQSESVATEATPSPGAGMPIIALVHGAWADSSSWAGVIPLLEDAGVDVVAIANPLRGPSVDGAYVASVASAIPGPVLLVGHSYGGAVITQAGPTVANAVGLVFVAAFAPDEGETGLGVLSNYPPTEISQVLRPTPVMDAGATEPRDEFTVDRARFHDIFAADLPEETAKIMAVTQRPLSSLALGEPFGPPAWKTLPSWAVIATGDKVIGTAAVRGMAERAGATSVDVDASHAVMVSQPRAVTDVILTAYRAVA